MAESTQGRVSATGRGGTRLCPGGHALKEGDRILAVETEKYASLGLTAQDLRQMFRLMLLARAFDERISILVRQNKIEFAVLGVGQEAAQVGAAWALRPGIDWACPYYRDIGVVLTLGMSVYEAMLGEFARADDPCSGGRQMPKHWSYRRLRIFTGSSPVATQIPHAVGLALAARLQGEDSVVFVSFGEGATSKGDFHEGVNFAAIHRLPVIFFCENNRYAISVPYEKQVPVAQVAARAAAYGIPGVSVDGNDVLAVYEAMREAVARARSGEGPTLVEACTYRLVPHTSNDDDRRYRSRAEVEAWRERDPIPRFERLLVEAGLLTPEEATRMREEVAQEVLAAAERAERAPEPDPESATAHVYGEEPA